MKLDWDPAKSAKNAKERDLPFDLTIDLDWSAAQIIETRYAAVAPLHGRLHVVVYILRDDKRRIISFRKANEIEEKAYEKANAARDEAADETSDR
jgi:uncharacterized DUF497 family protein